MAKTHGLSNTRIHRIWHNMRKRCYYEKDKYYKNYGGRGIEVCDEWQNFEPFYNWAMANGYEDGLSIDRIDNDGDYCPENCRFITMREQSRNRRSNVLVTLNGETKTLMEWAEIYRIDYDLLRKRYVRYNWDIEKALTAPLQIPMIEINGEVHKRGEWSKISGVPAYLITQRIQRGWSNEAAVMTPVMK